MVGLEILISIPPENRQEFMQACKLLSRSKTDRSLGSGACLERCVYESIENPNQFLWREKWNDFEVLAEYLESDRYRALQGAIQVLGTLNSVSKCEISQLSEDA